MMKLSEKHQEVLDLFLQEHPDFKLRLEGEEANAYHIMFVKIVKDGKWARGVPIFQKYFEKEWLQTKRVIENPTYGILAATGHDEYCIVYDPTEKAQAEVKPESKPAKARKAAPKNA